MIDLATLTALAQAATPGNWQVHDQDITGVWRVEYPGEVYPSFVLGCYKGKADVDYIVATQPCVILALVARVQELTDALYQIRREQHCEHCEAAQCAHRIADFLLRKPVLTPSEPRDG